MDLYRTQDGLDFSSTIFGQLVGDENCQAGRLDGLTCECGVACNAECRRKGLKTS